MGVARNRFSCSGYVRGRFAGAGEANQCGFRDDHKYRCWLASVIARCFLDVDIAVTTVCGGSAAVIRFPASLIAASIVSCSLVTPLKIHGTNRVSWYRCAM